MLKCIPVSALRIGMYIQEFSGSWMDHPFFKSSFLLKNEKDLQRIRDSGIAEVWIDADRGLDITSEIESRTVEQVATEVEARLLAAEQKPSILRSEMHEELERAAKICSDAKAAVITMFNGARMGSAIDPEQAAKLIEEIAASVRRHPYALISLARLKSADEYTYMHSVAVCALMIALARQLGMAESLVREVGLAGLLHDIGKMTIPLAVLNKPGRLTDAEFEMMRKHPEEGGKILLENERISALVFDVCLHHHERVDGTGYPHRLTGEQISVFAKMGAVCDVYDAISSDRPYKKGWDPAESISKMAEWCKGHFDEGVFQAFVKLVGIYPIGSLVRLKSGYIGVVIEQNDKSLLSPKVKVIFCSKSKAPVPQRVVDLASLDSHDKIISRESTGPWSNVDIDKVWMDYIAE